MAYTYSNLLEAMTEAGKQCNHCSESDVWTSNKLKFLHTGLAFSSGGASGFFKQGDVALRDVFDEYSQQIIADQDFYCPLCKEYWPSTFGCKTHCIGCENAAKPANRC